MAHLNEHEINDLYNAYQDAGGGAGRWPEGLPIASIDEIEAYTEIWDWTMHAGQRGVMRQLQHNRIHVAGVDHIFEPNGFTNVWVARPRSTGTGDVTPNKNLVLIVPPRRVWVRGDEPGVADHYEHAPLYVIELGCKHEHQTTELISACYRHVTCNDCGFKYALDSSD